MIGFANFHNIKYHCIKVILGYEGKYVNLYQSDRTYHTRVVMVTSMLIFSNDELTTNTYKHMGWVNQNGTNI